jgi:small ligand-binding sensory domain FIST
VAEACERARAEVGPGGIDLCAAFASASFGLDLERLPALLHERLAPRALFGCTGGGIIGGGREIEGRPALSLVLGRLPGARVLVEHLHAADLPSEDAGPRAWTERIGTAPANARGFVVLPEPFHFPADRLLAGLDFAYPELPKIGGIASGSRHPRGNMLFAGTACHHEGAVVAAFTGDVAIAPVLAQGCKPIGAVGTITRAEDNTLAAIDQMPAVRFLERQLEGLDEGDRELATTRPIFLGIAMSPFTDPAQLGPGDYLIRNVLGFDPEAGTLTIGDTLAPGRRVQFHVMDHHTSAFDLRGALQRRRSVAKAPPAGALMFSCLGRGQGLYGEPDHDSRLFREELADAPLGGFFCNGEIGPVHDTTYLHGYTASIAVFAPNAGA